MKITNITKGIALTLSLSLLTVATFAQKSPKAEAVGKINGANLVIKYNSPFVKGRKIYGTDLVPYDGRVWRAGADTATRFYTDKDIMVEGKKLAAGAYSIYMIGSDKDWTIIFNSKVGQWGVIDRNNTTSQDPAFDVLRVKVTPKKADKFHESLEYAFHANGFVMNWENLSVPVSIK